MAERSDIVEALAKSHEALAETLANAFQGLKFARTPKLKLSRFNGSPAKPGDCSLDQWLEEFDFYSRQLELTEAEQLEAALDHLGGVAKDEIACCPLAERDTIQKLIALLNRLFGQSENIAALTSAFYARNQYDSETLTEFSREIMLIHDRMERVADGPERAALQVMRDKALKERLVQGARDEAVRRELRRLRIERPELPFYKFREHVLELFPERQEKRIPLRNKCRMTAAFDDEATETKKRPHMPEVQDVLSQLVATNKLVVEKLEALSENQAATNANLAELAGVLNTKVDKALSMRSGRSGINCDHCKRPGHHAKNCWQKFPALRPAKPEVNSQENVTPPP